MSKIKMEQVIHLCLQKPKIKKTTQFYSYKNQNYRKKLVNECLKGIVDGCMDRFFTPVFENSTLF